MKVRFWGVRGSLAAPGPATLRYGGNTTCIEVRTEDNTIIVLDGGTGIFPLGHSLLREMPLTAHVFISHTHWDHIQGLPLFVPIFIPKNVIRIHGPYDIVAGSGIDQVMNVQLQYSYFPVREAELRATLEYETLTVGQPVQVGDSTVTGHLLNHPVVNLGYRIDSGGRSMFFTGDHEPYFNIYDPEDPEYPAYQAMLDEKQCLFEDFIRGVDLLVADSAYTISEYPSKRGWGHGTFDSVIQLGLKVGAKRIVCTHHEPTRNDDALEKAFQEAVERCCPSSGGPEVMLAREGLELTF